MFNSVKSEVFSDLTPRQKSQLVSFLRSFVKKNETLCVDDILDKFIEDETYYFEIGSPHFEFVIEKFESEKFLNDTKKFIKSVFKELEFKEAQKPHLERQKAFAKEQRKRANDYKMSKLPPTKKQLYFYERLTKSHGLEMKDVQSASRLDLKNWLMEIIEPKEEDDESEFDS